MYRISSFSDYEQAYRESIKDSGKFWSDIARCFFWRELWDSSYNWDDEEKRCSWFVGGKLNITENIFERRLYSHSEKLAVIWEPNHPDDPVIKLTYGQLFWAVNGAARYLKSIGVSKGDRVVLYMPLCIEAIIGMLACARIGAIHSVVFGGFSSQALADRIVDSGASFVVTADGGFRGSKLINTLAIVHEGVGLSVQGGGSTVRHVVVVPHLRRSRQSVKSEELGDIDSYSWPQGVGVSFWNSENEQEVLPAEIVDSEHPLFVLYTSGSTGKPKGVVHSTGGYMVYGAYTFENVFQYNAGDIFWCTADVGWITGHSYLVYGPLLCGATIVVCEGTPFFPDAGRMWNTVQKFNVSHLYTAPTVIRSLQGMSIEYVEEYDLQSLRVLGSVGEPLNEDAWHWYHHHIGKGRCPIVDTWWQTETGGIMISSLAGIIPSKPSFSTLPLPGIDPVILDDAGNELKGRGVEGNLAIRSPWPGMIRGTFGDLDRYKETYFSRFKGVYFTGDGARRDEDGYYRILGRVDVINVSGHRLGTAEIESAINEHPLVVESAVVGMPHRIKGECVLVFVVPEDGKVSSSNESVVANEVNDLIRQLIGAVACPEKLLFIPALPKTRSGKIMRRVLKKIANGQVDEIGDVSTLLNPEVIDIIMDLWQSAK
jgi:acetyl-CoA synthetase